MQDDDRETQQLLLSVFVRKGGEGQQTKKVAMRFSDELSGLYPTLMHKGELPVIFMFENGKITNVITTQRVVFFTHPVNSVYFSELKEVTPQRPRIGIASNLGRLLLKEEDGTASVLNVEPGRAFSGVWNLLIRCARRRRASV